MKYAIVSAASLEPSNWGVIFLPFYLLLSEFPIKMDWTLIKECPEERPTAVGPGQQKDATPTEHVLHNMKKIAIHVLR